MDITTVDEKNRWRLETPGAAKVIESLDNSSDCAQFCALSR
jgi:hypothetical protein